MTRTERPDHILRIRRHARHAGLSGCRFWLVDDHQLTITWYDSSVGGAACASAVFGVRRELGIIPDKLLQRANTYQATVGMTGGYVDGFRGKDLTHSTTGLGCWAMIGRME